jgi:hypothetical protein
MKIAVWMDSPLPARKSLSSPARNFFPSPFEGEGQKGAENGIVNRARNSTLNKDPHLRSSPLKGEGQRGAENGIVNRARFRILRGLSASSPRSLSRTAEKLVDCVKHFLHIREHLIVPESKHAVSVRIQKRSANFIFLRKLGVLSAIQFDNEASFDRAEVGEVRTNRMLTAELGVAHPAAAQMSPQDSFRVGLFAPQPPRVPLGRFDRGHGGECLSA